MTGLAWFDSLVHVTADGSWLGQNRYDAGCARLIAELDRVGPWRACLVSIAGHTDNDFTLDVAKAHPDRFVPIAGVDPTSSTRDPCLQVMALKAQGFRGIKLHPRLNDYDPMDERVLACVVAASAAGLVVYMDTLFRRRGGATLHPVDVVDHLAAAVALVPKPAPLVLLHGTGATLLELFELARAHSHLLVDLSFTIMRYAGSSLDDDIGFMCEQLDQRVVVGSDMPEYRPVDVLSRLESLTDSLSEEKKCNVLYKNLENLFPVEPETLGAGAA